MDCDCARGMKELPSNIISEYYTIYGSVCNDLAAPTPTLQFMVQFSNFVHIYPCT